MYLKRLSNKDMTKLVFKNEEEYIDFTHSIADSIPASNKLVKECVRRFINALDENYVASDKVEGNHPSAFLMNNEIVDLIPIICSLANDKSNVVPQAPPEPKVDLSQYVTVEEYNSLVKKYNALMQMPLGHTGHPQHKAYMQVIEQLKEANLKYKAALADEEAAIQKHTELMNSISQVAPLLKALKGTSDQLYNYFYPADK